MVLLIVSLLSSLSSVHRMQYSMFLVLSLVSVLSYMYVSCCSGFQFAKYRSVSVAAAS